MNRRHGIWIAAWSVIGWVGTALAPALANEPLLLMMLSPRALFVALASDSTSLLKFVVLGTLRLSVTDASYYIVGRRLPKAVCLSGSTDQAGGWKRAARSMGRRGDRICRWFCDRPWLAGIFLFARPNGKYLAVAGAYGVRPVLAGLSAVCGTAAFLTAMHLGVHAIF